MDLIERIRRRLREWLLMASGSDADHRSSFAQELEAMKEDAINAIAHRNQLRRLLPDQTKRAVLLEVEARNAAKRGDAELARELWIEREKIDLSIFSLKIESERAEREVIAQKRRIRSLEGRVRRAAAERLALTFGMRQSAVPPGWAVLVPVLSLLALVAWLVLLNA